MKIAIIAHLKFPIAEPFHGGLEMHTHCLTEALMRRGHDVTLFALRESDHRFQIVQPTLDAITPTPGVDLFDGEPGFGLEFVNKFHAYMEVLQVIQRSDFDVVHNNCLHFLPLSLAHTLGCPMVTTLHCPPFASLRSGVILARPYLGNQFVAVSESIARQWTEDITHCRVVLNGIQVDRWAFSRRGREGTAFWFGRFCPEKGPHHAIRAAKLAGYRLRLAGSIYDHAYFDRCIAPELDDRIEYVGHLDHAGICREAGNSAVGLFTSVWEEPFGLVLAELLACGTPIVSFDSGAAREIVGTGCGVIVPKGDAAAMASAIPQAAGLDRAYCRQYAERHFGIDRMIDDYQALYQKLAPNSGKTREAVLHPPSISVA
ncbi:glycosyltransferase involved in cell wall biosynthesis [Neolewinella xylanilytica]|uniref:Glycosyltransferase involved in cell wall biosynthesis n=1 Tax=Neolewinella xylanilytica TaxID=1514080 RepID=A0A2S6IAV6_9BACT|nr:glycosyltransferase family 4 protein [Neolewinella xylanilytica]PPK88628.1 glycosyltransferase involved in cell wall biosynthesis [Neolewinella xylanilytica]